MTARLRQRPAGFSLAVRLCYTAYQTNMTTGKPATNRLAHLTLALKVPA
jgi:hypothetical protein